MNIQNLRFSDYWGNRHLRLLVVLFGVALVAKGGVLSRGFAVDDYSFGQGFTKENVELLLTQGRILLIGIVSAVKSLGVDISDLYVSLGLVALFLQAAFVLAILRFVGAADSPKAMLVGAVMVVHPYAAEILTFRMVLPGYCVAAALSILVLESIYRASTSYKAFIVASLATVGMLFIYQGFLNYFAVAIIFAYLFGVFAKEGREKYNKRAAILTAVCIFSSILFLVVLSISKRLGLIEPTGRAKFIEWHDISARLGQLRELLLNIYWQSEPVTPHWIKILIALAIFIAIVVLFLGLSRKIEGRKSLTIALGVLLALVLLIPATVGVIAPFKEWWPVPRVLSQVSVILGLLFLLAYSICRDGYARIPAGILTVSLGIVLVAFIFINNQIFADQEKLNSWDKMKANRIVARLESHPDFPTIEAVFIKGGSWRHAEKLNTIQGDLNISAFSPEYSKIPLLKEASGYGFKKASSDQKVIGEKYCADAKPWPDKESTSIINKLAIVCLPE